MRRSDAINELAAALSKAQMQFESAERSHVAKVTSRKGEGSSYVFNYADLAAYLEVCRAPLADNGLSFIQEPTCDGNVVSVTTLLMHSSGQWIESEPLRLTLTGETLTPQVIGSGITYARRYSLSAIIGMASEQDDDGNAASGNVATTAAREKSPPCPKCGSAKAVIRGKAEYGGGWLCWKKQDGCGETWHDAPEPDAGTKPVEQKPAAMTALDKKEIDNLRTCFTKSMFEPAGLAEDQTTRKAHADAVVRHLIGKSWQDVATTPGLAAQAKERLFALKDAGADELSIYTDAKIAAGLATELETEMAGVI